MALPPLLGAQPSRNKVSERTRLSASCWVLGHRPSPRELWPLWPRHVTGGQLKGARSEAGRETRLTRRRRGAQRVGGRLRSCPVQAMSCLLHTICQGPRRVVLSGWPPVGVALCLGTPQATLTLASFRQVVWQGQSVQ